MRVPHIDRRKLFLLLRRVVAGYRNDNCSQLAAAISYYALFALVPLVLVLTSVFGLLLHNDDLEREVIDRLVNTLPLNTTDGRNFVETTVHGVSRVSGPLGVFALLAAAWTSSALFGSVRKSLNIVWHTDQQRPFVQAKLIDLGCIAGLGTLLLASIGSTVALRTIQAATNDLLGPLSSDSGLFWQAAPFVLLALLTFTAFLLLYRYIPHADNSFGDVWPGALVATILFEILKNGFAFYVANFNNYDAVYGVLGGIFLFLTFMYFGASIVLLGAELAAEYPRVHTARYDFELAAPSDGRTVLERVVAFVRGLFVGDKKRAGTVRDARR